MQIFRSVKQKIINRQDGQSLVEVAIAAPLLILMFIGVFEVGWALRGYLVLANVNREAARFAVKNTVLDFSVKNSATVGYNTVLSHTTASLATQLPLDFLSANPNSTMIMSHMVIDTGYPCVEYQGGTPKLPYEFDTNCDCQESDPNAAQWFTRDDLILHPQVSGYSYFAQTYGISRTTRIGGGNYAVEAEQLTLENNQFNCSVLKTGNVGELSSNDVFIAETFFDQPQLLGVPFVSNALTDPIPFYTHTAMRIVASREGDTDEAPACEVYPITFHDGIFSDQGYDPNNPPANIPIDAYEGSGSGQFGWLTWNPDPAMNDPNYVYEEMINPRLSLHDFQDAVDSSDTSLNIGDNISSGPGVMNSSDVETELDALEGRTILVPIYNTGGGTGQNTYFTVTHFASIRIDRACLPSNGCPDVSGSDKLIEATFLGYQDDACE